MPFIARSFGGENLWHTLAYKRNSVDKSQECSPIGTLCNKSDFYMHMERWEYSNPEKYQTKSSIKSKES